MVLKEPSPDVLDAWRVEFSASCAASDAAVQVISRDVTGDGEADQVCWRTRRDAEAWVQLQVSVNGREAYALFPAHRALQFAVCSIESIKVHVDPWAKEANEFFGLDKSPGPIAITVSDGECDPIHFFWSDEGDDGKPTLIWLRA